MFQRISTLATLALLTGCVSAPPPPQVPLRRPVQAPRPLPVPAPDTVTSRPFTAGSWSYAGDPHSSNARFVDVSRTLLFSLQCDKRIRETSLLVSRGAASVTPLAITLRASTSAKAVTGTGGGPLAVVMLDRNDPILDAMAFSRGSFSVQAGTSTFTLPARPELARVVEDCRG